VQLRAALASGKVTPSTLVWREGMKEPAPAFTLAELSSAAIAARRSALPPRPKASSAHGDDAPVSSRDSVRAQLRPPSIPPGARKPPPRAPMRTLVGLEPETMAASLGLGPKEGDGGSATASASEADEAAALAPPIPAAPKLPLDAETTAVDPQDIPPAKPPTAPSSQGRHRTLLGGLAPSATSQASGAVDSKPSNDASASPEPIRSQPPPPPRRKAAVAPRSGASGAGDTQTLTRPRQRSVPPPPPRRRPSGTDHVAAQGATAPPTASAPRPLTALETEETEPARLAHATRTGEGVGAASGSQPAPSQHGTDDHAAASLRGLTKTLEMEHASSRSEHAHITDDEDDAPTRQFDKDAMGAGERRPSPSDVPPAADPQGGERRARTSSAPPHAADEDEHPSRVLDARHDAVRRDAVEIPLSSLVAASAVWIVGLVAFFFAGRMTGHQSAARSSQLRSGVELGYRFTTAPQRATSPEPSAPKPCWVTRQPTRWLPAASRSVPFDLRASGQTMELGLAVDDQEAVGLLIDPRTGKFEEKFRKRTDREVARVMPMGQGEGFLVSEEGGKTLLPVGDARRLFVTLSKDAIGASDAVDGDPSVLWTLEGDDTTSAESVLAAGSQYFFVMRRGRDVQAGWFDGDKRVAAPLATIPGSGGRGGKPKSGFNGKEVAVTFADKPDDETPWQIRLAKAAPGSTPTSSEVVKLPEGGPGGDAIAPDVVGFDDGRWLLMWTEGEAGKRAIRAQTFAPGLEPVGDPIALSPPAGNFGQAVLGTVGGYTTVVFLQRGETDYELWGAVLQCGS
jgi:hypothetical protein